MARAGNNYLDHPDSHLVSPSPIPLLIVLNKYDVLKSDVSLHRRCLHQAVRFIAHNNGAHIVSASNREKSAKDAFRSIARQVLFPPSPPTGTSSGYRWAKAAKFGDGVLSIKPGQDTFDAILSVLPKGTVKSDFIQRDGVASDAGETWKRTCEDLFGPASEQKSKDPADYEDADADEARNAAGAYPEPAVDEAVAESEIRLTDYKKEIERRNEIAAAVDGGGAPRVRRSKKSESSSRK